MNSTSAHRLEEPVNPIDILELLIDLKDWQCDRQGDELTITVEGSWCAYHISLHWNMWLEALHLACAFDVNLPQNRIEELRKLILLINERLWLGHFDIWPQENAIVFRHGHLLTGGLSVSQPQAEALLKAGIEACEQYFTAFQFVIWGGKGAEEALKLGSFETVGHA